MEQISQIVTLIGSAIATILLPLLGAFMFYDSKKRREAAQAEKAEADNISQYAAEMGRNFMRKKKLKFTSWILRLTSFMLKRMRTVSVSGIYRPKTQSWNLRIRL